MNKNYNRAVIIALIGLFSALWVLVNSFELFFSSAIIYVVFPLVAIFLYWGWDKFGGFR